MLPGFPQTSHMPRHVRSHNVAPFQVGLIPPHYYSPRPGPMRSCGRQEARHISQAYRRVAAADSGISGGLDKFRPPLLQFRASVIRPSDLIRRSSFVLRGFHFGRPLGLLIIILVLLLLLLLPRGIGRNAMKFRKRSRIRKRSKKRLGPGFVPFVPSSNYNERDEESGAALWSRSSLRSAPACLMLYLGFGRVAC